MNPPLLSRCADRAEVQLVLLEETVLGPACLVIQHGNVLNLFFYVWLKQDDFMDA